MQEFLDVKRLLKHICSAVYSRHLFTSSEIRFGQRYEWGLRSLMDGNCANYMLRAS